MKCLTFPLAGELEWHVCCLCAFPCSLLAVLNSFSQVFLFVQLAKFLCHAKNDDKCEKIFITVTQCAICINLIRKPQNHFHIARKKFYFAETIISFAQQTNREAQRILMKRLKQKVGKRCIELRKLMSRSHNSPKTKTEIVKVCRLEPLKLWFLERLDRNWSLDH